MKPRSACEVCGDRGMISIVHGETEIELPCAGCVEAAGRLVTRCAELPDAGGCPFRDDWPWLAITHSECVHPSRGRAAALDPYGYAVPDDCPLRAAPFVVYTGVGRRP